MNTVTDLYARLPWVTRLDETKPCDGYRWNHMPGKALRDPALFAKYRCKNRARWQFRALRTRASAWPRDGIYCWPHLQVQLHSMDEEAAPSTAWQYCARKQ
jgi:hypothetical protein